jgi:glutamine amidotransferase
LRTEPRAISKEVETLLITIIDYGAGNLHSVVSAIKRLGYQSQIVSTSDKVLTAQAVILPGVGAAANTLSNLESIELASPIRRFIAEGRPFLGVCIGMQILFSSTEEGGWHDCLNIVRGVVKRLPKGHKIPHMGWNQVKQKVNHPIFNGIPDEANFYFVHSYYVAPDDRSMVAGETDYGIPICSVIAQGNLIATQFHPEKSGEFGLKLYDNFIKMALEAKSNKY